MDYLEAMAKTKTELYQTIKELEAENARLRQQSDAANAQLDFLIEEVKTRSED